MNNHYYYTTNEGIEKTGVYFFYLLFYYEQFVKPVNIYSKISIRLGESIGRKGAFPK